jgi:rhodanese-related sulfurtransferase
MKRMCFILIIPLFISLISCGSYNYSYNGNELKNITVEEFLSFTEDKLTEFTIVDVRTKAEFDSGHIKNAVNKPVQEINSVDDLKIFDINKPVLVYCRSGHRSFAAAKVFVQAGFETYNLLGGISELVSKGYNLVED